MNYKTFIAASLMSIALTSAAFAQCAECALYPGRDPLNNGAATPASKMMAGSGGAAGSSMANSENSIYDARAEARLGDVSVRTGGRETQHRHYRDANASIAEGFARVDTPTHEVYIKNLHDSGYDPAGDFNAAGNIKVN